MDQKSCTSRWCIPLIYRISSMRSGAGHSSTVSPARFRHPSRPFRPRRERGASSLVLVWCRYSAGSAGLSRGLSRTRGLRLNLGSLAHRRGRSSPAGRAGGTLGHVFRQAGNELDGMNSMKKNNSPICLFFVPRPNFERNAWSKRVKSEASWGKTGRLPRAEVGFLRFPFQSCDRFQGKVDQQKGKFGDPRGMQPLFGRVCTIGTSIEITLSAGKPGRAPLSTHSCHQSYEEHTGIHTKQSQLPALRRCWHKWAV